MILQRLASLPSMVFGERDLLQECPQEFEAFRELGLVRERLALVGEPAQVYSGGRYALAATGDGYLGIELDSDEPEVIEFAQDDVRLWTADIPALVRHLARTNDLRGQPEEITDRLWYIGDAHEREAVLLGLFADAATLDSQLTGLPSRFPSPYGAFLVVCPTNPASPQLLRRLEGLGIRLCESSKNDPFHLPLVPAKTSNGLVLSPDYRSATRGQEVFPLTARRAAVIRILDRARRAGSPDVHWDQIKRQLKADEYYPESMQDVFKGLPKWRDLVTSRTRGYWRLNF